MSLPVRRPADEHAPIIRQDGQYTLIINPKPVVESINGHKSLHSLGVPYGSLPRLVLIHIMTEAVRTKSRHIVLGQTFTEWMRRLGFRTVSYGPRGSATLIKEQLDRLLACEWMIKWEAATDQGEREFGIKEIKLTNEYAGVDRKNGAFIREIYMTEGILRASPAARRAAERDRHPANQGFGDGPRSLHLACLSVAPHQSQATSND